MALLKANTGIGITDPSEALHVIGNGLFEGIVSATSFTGNLSGTATSAINLVGGEKGSVPYQSAVNSTTFLAPGSPGSVLVTNGTGQNPTWSSLSALSGAFNGVTIRDEGSLVGSADSIRSINFVGPNVVATASGVGATITLSNDAQYLTGTAPGSVISQSSGFSVTGNVTISGNLSVGGTSVILNAATLSIKDKDIVLGITTNALNQDVSTDFTANHGGIAIASTEGSPLIDINGGVGTDSIPSTYKQIMWLKSGSWTGLGTDAWLFNYGVGIGSTQLPNGTRLAVGSVQFTQNDLLGVRNINASGIITATQFVGSLLGNVTSADYATRAGIATNVIGGIGSITQLQVTGVSTFTNGPVLVGTATSTGTASQPLQVSGGAYVSGNLGIGTTRPTSALQVQGNLLVSGVSTIGTIRISSGIVTASSGIVTYYGDGSKLSNVTPPLTVKEVAGNPIGIGTTVLSISNVNTILFDRDTGFNVTNNGNGEVFVDLGSTFAVWFVPGSNDLRATGEDTVEFIAGPGIAITTKSTSTGVGTGLSKSITFTDINWIKTSVGIHTFTNVGIGTTNPSQSLHIQGNARLTGALYDSSNAAGSSGQILSSTGSAISWINASTTNVGSANSIAITADSTNASRYLTFVSTTSGNNVVYVDSDLLYNPSTNSLAINGTSFTGTASQNLQVTGGTYVSGNLGIGTTNPGAKLQVTPTFTGIAGIFSGTTSSDMVRITQLGTGNAIVVEDEINPDSSPFVITGIGSVGVGTANPQARLSIGSVSGFQDTRTTVASISPTTIDSFSSTIFRSARVQVQITQGTNYQASDVLIIHDGSTADVIEYGSIATNDYLGTFSAIVSGGNCLLRINMSSATSATVKVLSQRITI